MSGTVELEQRQGMAILRLNNPSKWNCFTTRMLAQMSDHMSAVERDSSVRALIITSAGEKAFCSGADIKEWEALSPRDFARYWLVDGHRLFDRVAQFFAPTIAALPGHAFGGGLELAAACDLRVMAEHAELALPEAGIGIVPGWSGTQRLARLLPPSVLKEMAIFGRRISAQRACELGFVAERSANPEARALEIAEELLLLSPRSVEINKRAINAASGEGTAMMIDTLAGAAAAATDDKSEGVNAFMEKRTSNFCGE